MKRILGFALAAGLTLGSVGTASAIDFKVKGSWDMYFNFGQTTFFKTPYNYRNTGASYDVFEPDTRIRLQLDAVASENLSGTVQFEIGTTTWGRSGPGNVGRASGGALGTDGVSVEVKHAFIDWLVPNTELRVRMGLQNAAMPNTAGGSAVLDDDAAGIVASYKINDNAGVTAMWARPYNDNYVRDMGGGRDASNFLDNFDLVMLSVPLTFDAFSATPWGMYGFAGDNMARSQLATGGFGTSDIYVQRGIFPVDLAQGRAGGNPRFKKGYANMFWAGLPVAITAFDPLNIEFDANYGYSSGWGRYDDARALRADGTPRRNDTKREGWLVKALIEYKMDWATPGVFGWYASGDDGNTRNGSERMPTISPAGTFSSFALAGYDGDFRNIWIGEAVDTGYSGTWAIGAQLKDLSFLEDLSHTLRVIYWRGTNDPAMARALSDPTVRKSFGNTAWNQMPGIGGLYLTSNDYLVELNLDSRYKIYENLETIVELGYIINGVDKNTWKWTHNQKEDAWKCSVNFRYSF